MEEIPYKIIDRDGNKIGVVVSSWKTLLTKAEKEFSITPPIKVFLEDGTLVREDFFKTMAPYSSFIMLNENESFPQMIQKKETVQPECSNDNVDAVPSLKKNVETLYQAVQNLAKEVNFQKSISSFMYKGLGEAADLVRDYIKSIDSKPAEKEYFKTQRQLSNEDLLRLTEQTHIYPKARDKICHINDQNIELFSKNYLGSAYDVLELDKPQIFPEL